MEQDIRRPGGRWPVNAQGAHKRARLWHRITERNACFVALMGLLSLVFAGPARAVEVLNFGTLPGGGNLLTTPANITVGGIAVNATGSQSGGPWTSSPSMSAMNARVFMAMTPGAGSSLPWSQVTFSFSRPVTNLEFSLTDVDGGPLHTWNDRVVIDSIPSATPVVVSQGAQVSWTAATRTAQATSNANVNGTAANIRLRIARPVTQVTVRYVAGPILGGSSSGPASQSISLEDVRWDSGAVSVQKLTSGGVGGPFAFTQTNLLTTPAAITTSAMNTATPASATAHEIDGPGTDVILTESALSGWALTAATCTDANSAVTGNAGNLGSLSGNTVTLPASTLVLSGANITCRFTNTQPQTTDIQVVKSAAPDPVVSGDGVIYTLVTTNNGPMAVTNVVLSDVPGAGQTCTAPATCAATGGASCPSPTVPSATLTGSGMTIPSLPVGGQVTVVLQCTVAASGTP